MDGWGIEKLGEASNAGKLKREAKKCRGASLRGQGSPGFILPASAVSEQENCGGNSQPPNSVLFRVRKLHLRACRTSPESLKHF